MRISSRPRRGCARCWTPPDRSGGLRASAGICTTPSKPKFPTKVFHGGFRIHSAMLKAANACDGGGEPAPHPHRDSTPIRFPMPPSPRWKRSSRAERALHPDRRIPEGQRRQRRPARLLAQATQFRASRR
ncbi:MAG: hypothetical protein ACLSHC_02415 [Bilophila wadsworthia]